MGFPWPHWGSALLSTTLAPFYRDFNSGNTLSLVPPQGRPLHLLSSYLQMSSPPDLQASFLSSTEISAQPHSSEISFLTNPTTAAHRPAHTVAVLRCISPWHLAPFKTLLSTGFHLSVYCTFSVTHELTGAVVSITTACALQGCSRQICRRMKGETTAINLFHLKAT